MICPPSAWIVHGRGLLSDAASRRNYMSKNVLALTQMCLSISREQTRSEQLQVVRPPMVVMASAVNVARGGRVHVAQAVGRLPARRPVASSLHVDVNLLLFSRISICRPRLVKCTGR